MNAFTRSDLACEAGTGEFRGVSGIRYREEREEGCRIERMTILTEACARQLGKPRGTYITLHCRPLWRLGEEERGQVATVLARELRRLCLPKEGISERFGVLVAGLGNAEITADAVGPLAVRELLVTRHLKEHEPQLFYRMGCCAVSALAPGVLGQTGMEASDVVAGAVRRCHADVIIAIDALAAKSCERLAATVQLSNTGIAPGSGIGNDGNALNAHTLGIPVIAIGIPTVVDSSTLVYDALRQANITGIDERLRHILENGRRFYVSPKEADQIARCTAQTVAHAINRALVGVAKMY